MYLLFFIFVISYYSIMILLCIYFKHDLYDNCNIRTKCYNFFCLKKNISDNFTAEYINL